jgi:hypothetical protein
MTGRGPSIFKPTTLRVIRLLKQHGVPNRIIAVLVGSTPGSVSATCAQFGIRCDGYIGAQVGLRSEAAFQREADRRGVVLSVFIKRVMQKIARDDLFSTILDERNDG